MSYSTKHIASLSLGAMGVGFLATLPFEEGMLGLLQGGFEAGVVGGLADWFAVTALFRHPLGIPIPHTAILPKNRAKLTHSVISMLESELLNKESIRAKITHMNLLKLVLRKLQEESNSDAVKKGMATVLETVLLHLPTEKIAVYVNRELNQIIEQLNEKKVLQVIIDEAIQLKFDEQALNLTLEKVEQWVTQDETRQYLGAMGLQQLQQLQLNGLMQFAMNAFIGYLTEEKVGVILQTFIMNNLLAFKLHGHPKREKLLTSIRNELYALPHNPKVLNELSRWKKELAQHEAINQTVTTYIEEAKERLLQLIRSGDLVEQWLIPFIQTTANRISQNEEMVRVGENWTQNQIIRIIENNYSKLGELVQENLDKLDNKALIQFIEEKVGRDLQWIRVNGAICGFLVGIALNGIKLFVI